MRLQSALEYLMTYSWVLLILAVVLGTLYFLGVFNGLATSPKLQPGACFVYRPNGPNTNQFVALEGTCTGEIPEFVGTFNGQSYLGGNSMYVFPISDFEWVDPTGFGSGNDVIISLDANSGANTLYWFGFTASGDLEMWNGQSTLSTTLQVPSNTWSFVGYTLSTNSLTVFLDSNSQTLSSTTASFSSSNGLWYIGQTGKSSGYMQGYVADVQIYNLTFPSNTANAIYLSGIGGVPLNLENLIAWWPINGNGNDYSGDVNNANSIDIGYWSTWYNKYSAP